MPTTIEFPLFVNRSRRRVGFWRRPRRASPDVAILMLWAIIMLWIAAAVPVDAPSVLSVEDIAVQLLGGL